MNRSILFYQAKKILLVSFAKQLCSFNYTQGQSPPDNPKIREYFYFIDNFGQLFLDDTKFKNFTSCFKDVPFLKFFFSHLRVNDYERFEHEFPYVSLCGRERNYIRCDDVPIVFTNLKTDDIFNCWYIESDKTSIKFEPSKVYMKHLTGRIYHPAPGLTTEIGLIKDSISQMLSEHFTYDSDGHPKTITWKKKTYILTNEIEDKVNKYSLFNNDYRQTI